MKYKPVAIHSDELNDLINANSIPQGWKDEWTDTEGYPEAPMGWYLVSWPEQVTTPEYDSDCTITAVKEPEYTIYLDSWSRL